MRFTILTLFPEVFTYLDVSILKRARENNLVQFEFVNPRNFTNDKHRTIDDYPYGGGAGMVMKPDPVFKAVEHIREELKNTGPVALMSPQGEILNQRMVEKLAGYDSLVLICGHYEGFDERIRTLADKEISIGDYVLTGGELPAMVIIDAVCRMIPGVIDEESARHDSFVDNLLDHPQYTRPPVYRGMEVPPILRSGHHENIRKWRRKEKLKKTLANRPDLFEKANLTPEDMKLLREIFEELR